MILLHWLSDKNSDSLNFSACPTGYELGPTGDCYSFVRGAIEFHFARELCQRTDGGDLVVIETPREHEYIMNMTQEGDWWVGKLLYLSAGKDKVEY